MKVLDLFSGIGGFSLGLERAGMQTVAFCEIDPFCRQVLKKHWPDVPIYKDVRTIRDEFKGSIDLICGGYPCQPFSTAGKREGEEDDRHLWPEMFACIQHYRPRWVIGENVAGHISMGLDSVLSDLESEGYTTRAFVIPACALDAQHRRNRVWILANACGNRSQGITNKGSSSSPVAGKQKRRSPAGGNCKENMAHSYSGRIRPGFSSRQQRQEREPSGASYFNGEGGWGGLWLSEPSVGRVAHGVPNRVDRLKGLGNAVVPQIPEILAAAIMEIENDDYVKPTI